MVGSQTLRGFVSRISESIGCELKPITNCPGQLFPPRNPFYVRCISHFFLHFLLFSRTVNIRGKGEKRVVKNSYSGIKG